jgi:hypothetical protein
MIQFQKNHSIISRLPIIIDCIDNLCTQRSNIAELAELVSEIIPNSNYKYSSFTFSKSQAKYNEPYSLWRETTTRFLKKYSVNDKHIFPYEGDAKQALNEYGDSFLENLLELLECSKDKIIPVSIEYKSSINTNFNIDFNVEEILNFVMYFYRSLNVGVLSKYKPIQVDWLYNIYTKLYYKRKIEDYYLKELNEIFDTLRLYISPSEYYNIKTYLNKFNIVDKSY